MNSFLVWGLPLLLLGPVTAVQTPPKPDCSNLIHLAEGFQCTKLKPRRLAASDWTVFFARSKEQKDNKISIRVRPDVDSLRAASSKTISLLSKLSHPSLPADPQVYTGSGWIVRIDKGKEGRTLKSFVAKKDLATIQDLSPRLLTSLSNVVGYLNSNGLVVAGLTPETIEVKQEKEDVSVYLPDLDYTVGVGVPYDIRGDWRYWDLMRYPPYSQKHAFSPKVDSYSIGVLLYGLLHKGRFPFDVKDRSTYFTNLSKGTYTIDAGVQPELAILIAELMRQDSEKRLPVSAIETLCNELLKNKADAVLDQSITLNVDQELPSVLWQKAHPRFARRLLEVREGEESEAKTDKEVEEAKQRRKNIEQIVFWIFFGIMMTSFCAFYVWKMAKAFEIVTSDPESSDSEASDASDPLKDIRSMSAAERRKSEPRVVPRRNPEPPVDPTSLIRIEEVAKQASSANMTAPLETIAEQ